MVLSLFAMSILTTFDGNLATLIDTAIPAYAVSLTASQELADRILSNFSEYDFSSEQ